MHEKKVADYVYMHTIQCALKKYIFKIRCSQTKQAHFLILVVICTYLEKAVFAVTTWFSQKHRDILHITVS